MKNFLITIIIFNSLIYAENIAVIVNINNKIENISLKSLKKIYLKKVTEIEGVKIIPIDNRLIRDDFNDIVIKRNSRRINAYWAKMIFSGGEQPPLNLKNDKEIIIAVDDKDTIKKISNNIKYIGYILERNLDKNVKLLKLIEKSND